LIKYLEIKLKYQIFITSIKNSKREKNINCWSWL